MPENILEEVEGMFDERSDGGFGFLQGLAGFFVRAFGHRFDLAAFARDLPVRISVNSPVVILCPLILTCNQKAINIG
jgi:PII-like signaling protein